MHWSRRRRQRREQQQEHLLLQVQRLLQVETLALVDHQATLHRLLEQQLRRLLLEALSPVAAAMQRQDSQALDRHRELLELLRLQQEIQLEILDSQQLPLREVIFQELGPSMQR
jgi:hypothetical protein